MNKKEAYKILLGERFKTVGINNPVAIKRQEFNKAIGNNPTDEKILELKRFLTKLDQTVLKHSIKYEDWTLLEILCPSNIDKRITETNQDFITKYKKNKPIYIRYESAELMKYIRKTEDNAEQLIDEAYKAAEKIPWHHTKYPKNPPYNRK